MTDLHTKIYGNDMVRKLVIWPCMRLSLCSLFFNLEESSLPNVTQGYNYHRACGRKDGVKATSKPSVMLAKISGILNTFFFFFVHLRK